MEIVLAVGIGLFALAIIVFLQVSIARGVEHKSRMVKEAAHTSGGNSNRPPSRLQPPSSTTKRQQGETMGIWLQKKAEGIRMGLATRELKKILESKNRFDRADIRVAAASYLAGMEDMQAVQVFLSPEEYPRSTLMALYDQFESARNELQNYVTRLNNKANYDWGKGLDENFLATAQNQSAGLLALMVTLSAYMRDGGEQAARECWHKLQVGEEELSKAVSLAVMGQAGDTELMVSLARKYLPPFMR